MMAIIVVYRYFVL